MFKDAPGRECEGEWVGRAVHSSSAVKQNPLRKDGKREKNGWEKEGGWRSDKDVEEEYIMFAKAMLPTRELAN